MKWFYLFLFDLPKKIAAHIQFHSQKVTIVRKSEFTKFSIVRGGKTKIKQTKKRLKFTISEIYYSWNHMKNEKTHLSVWCHWIWCPMQNKKWWSKLKLVVNMTTNPKWHEITISDISPNIKNAHMPNHVTKKLEISDNLMVLDFILTKKLPRKYVKCFGLS